MHSEIRKFWKDSKGFDITRHDYNIPLYSTKKASAFVSINFAKHSPYLLIASQCVLSIDYLKKYKSNDKIDNLTYYFDGKQYSESEMLKIIKLLVFI